MKSTPLLMSQWSMNQYLKELKTQTRRCQGLDTVNENPDEWDFDTFFKMQNGDTVTSFLPKNNKDPVNVVFIKSPWGGIGDELWFREMWAAMVNYDNLPPREIPRFTPIWYSDAPLAETSYSGRGKTRSAMFMPKYFSRFPRVPITGLRCERVQSITIQDVIAEGIQAESDSLNWVETTRQHYADLWDSINGKKYPWLKNPWVFILEFPKCSEV